MKLETSNLKEISQSYYYNIALYAKNKIGSVGLYFYHIYQLMFVTNYNNFHLKLTGRYYFSETNKW